MADHYQITIDGKTESYPIGTTFEDIANVHQEAYHNEIALVTVNGKIRELIKKVDKDCEVKFITLSEEAGHKSYVRTASMILMKAISDIVGNEKIQQIKIEFAIGNGYYCSKKGDFEITEDLITSVRKRMHEIIDQNLIIQKKSINVERANELFASQNMYDKIKLIKYRRNSTINVYNMDGYYDYYYGYMLPSTGYVQYFDVEMYQEGLVLILPKRKTPTVMNSFIPMNKLYHTMMTASDWGTKMGIDTVGDLNNQICAGKFNDLVLVQEALQESKIGEIASEIVNRKNVKFVMIAGPSSSGKTTFSHRLSIQLRAHGMIPHPIGLDDYFRNREDTPKQPNGDYDYECLEALDVAQFNVDMSKLLAGEKVELPKFNFVTGKREYTGRWKQLGPDDILVIEGIHGLNEKTSHSLPAESKYKIYISALTTLNVDEHNRIPTTDGRLLRRMVRDARTRGASAKRTIQMWSSVRRGEEENIFPFQEDVDVMFNSTLIYELAVLKQYAEPLLFSIQPDEPEYLQAKSLLKFLSYFLGVSTEDLPHNSIVREFVGGSCFDV